MKEEKTKLYETLEKIDATINNPKKEMLRKAFQEAVSKPEEWKKITSQTESISKPFEAYKELVQDISVSTQLPSKNVLDALRSFSDVMGVAEQEGIIKREKMMAGIADSSLIPSLDYLSSIVEKSRYNMNEMAFLKEYATQELLQNRINQSGMKSALDHISKATIDGFRNWPDLYFDRFSKKFVSDGQDERMISVNEAKVISAGASFFGYIEKDCVTASELADFMSVLDRYPTMALKFDVAKRIERLICEVAPRIDFDQEYYFHSRSKQSLESPPFTYSEMLCAPAGVPDPGRFNHPGQAFYYFSDKKEGAELEIRKHNKNAVLQTAMIRHVKPINMVDLSGNIKQGKEFLRYLRFPKGEGNSKMPTAYLIPCFVSDCCRANGIEGIKYYGSEKYMNYVCWNAGYFEFVKMCEG